MHTEVIESHAKCTVHASASTEKQLGEQMAEAGAPPPRVALLKYFATVCLSMLPFASYPLTPPALTRMHACPKQARAAG